jgi:hypothetical protein
VRRTWFVGRRFRERPLLRRFVPYGVADWACQIALWVAFALAYEAVRGTAGHDRVLALRHGLDVLQLERGAHLLFEPRLQHVLHGAPPLASVVRWTYWGSEFSILLLALVWAYYRHRETYGRFRDAVLVANCLGLVGYLTFPTAPPRLYHAYGFVNTLSGQPRPSHAGGLIGFAANPYAAMPSIHAADALLLGVFLVALVKSRPLRVFWALWPAWVFFSVVSSGNHFWLDLVAGVAVALVGLAVAQVLAARRERSLGYRPLPPPPPAPCR